MPARGALAALVLLAGLLAGCGGGDDERAASATAPAALTTPAGETGLPREAEGESRPGAAIPDADEAGVSDTIQLERTAGGIASIAVAVGITHEVPSELVVTLEGPSGTRATLSDRESDGEDDLTLRLSEGDEELRGFLATQAGGQWTLTVTDAVPVDEGTLDSWSIAVRTDPDAQAPAAALEAQAEAPPGSDPQPTPGADASPGTQAEAGAGPAPGASPDGSAPASEPPLVPLMPYRAPDGGATAWVPSDPDWTISSSGGSLEGSSPRGGILLGQTFSIFLPGAVPPSSGPLPPSVVEHPFVDAADALRLVVPIINQRAGTDLTDVSIRQVLSDAPLPTFRSSGMFVYDFKVNGRPWVGVATIATEDRLSATFNQFWQMYVSAIAVPADGDPTVGAALRLVWRSWNPSGAIAARSEQDRQTLSEINDVWQGVNEFRSRTADQQSRDVSCLLRTGPFIDDNARQLGLPPLLDCESQYPLP